MNTEAEAKTKWCPFATASHTDPRRGFQDDDKYEATFPCLGQRCMAWRWGDPAEEIVIFKANEKDADFATRRDETLAKRRGYCGAAGKPIGAT